MLEHGAKPDFLASGIWVPTYADRYKVGYHINQLYSSTVSPVKLATRYLLSLYDVVAKTEFFNSSLGKTFVDDGSQITEETITRLQGSYLRAEDKRIKAAKHLSLGIDVGQTHHHYMLVAWEFDRTISTEITGAAKATVLDFGTFQSFDEIDNYIKDKKPKRIVIDAQPDLTNSTGIAKKFKGFAFACYYSTQKSTKNITMREDEGTISVNRSYWLNTVFQKIVGQSVTLPMDIPLELRTHLTSTVKTYKKDDNGNVFAEFVKKQQVPDHYLHALNYAFIAMGLMTT